VRPVHEQVEAGELKRTVGRFWNFSFRVRIRGERDYSPRRSAKSRNVVSRGGGGKKCPIKKLRSYKYSYCVIIVCVFVVKSLLKIAYIRSCFFFFFFLLPR